MKPLNVGEALIYPFSEKSKLILRREKVGFTVVHPLNLDQFYFNASGAMILDAYYNSKSKSEIVDLFKNLFPKQNLPFEKWINAFTNYLEEIDLMPRR